MSRHILLIPCLAAALGCTALITGCAGDRTNPQARATVTSATDARQELISAKAEIAKTLADLYRVEHQDELKKSFGDFSDDLAAVKTREKRVRDERERMQADSQVYITTWQQNASTYSNDDLRRSSIDRQATVKEHFTEITAAYRELEDDYRPFITTLSELQSSLANDLTPANVAAIKPVAEKAVTDGDKVQAQVDHVISKLDGLLTSMSPATPAEKK